MKDSFGPRHAVDVKTSLQDVTDRLQDEIASVFAICSEYLRLLANGHFTSFIMPYIFVIIIYNISYWEKSDLLDNNEPSR